MISVDCEKGSYLDGENGCKLCPKGTYGNAPGLKKCLDCPSGRVSELGSKRLRDCQGKYDTHFDTSKHRKYLNIR